MQTVLLGLNELNFDYIKYYADKGLLPTFHRLLSKNKLITTKSESEYVFQEPWIQWVTVYSGLSYEEHKIFRLGDIVDRKDVPQLFEDLEKSGFKVGAVSPFNADNRLKNPAFFIPDPWTQTSFSGGKLTQSVFETVRKMVNENAKGESGLPSLIKLFLGMLINVPPSRWPNYIKRAMHRNKPGMKAVILDSLLSDIFIKEWKKHKPDFSNLFLNTGAHIQHHYLFNSDAYDGEYVNPEWYCESDFDPLLEILKEYDNVLQRILGAGDINLLVATGLHQEPHGSLTYYWRPKNHANFIENLGLTDFTKAIPRMSRDFLIEFIDAEVAEAAEKVLNSYLSQGDDMKIFDVDNRGSSLFVELVYSNNITEGFSIYSPLTKLKIEDFNKHVAFVAIKNGEHNGDGYLFSNNPLGVDDTIPLTQVRSVIMQSVKGHSTAMVAEA